MTSRIAVFRETGPTGLTSADLAADRLRLDSFLVLSAWCGLVSGLLEVGIIVLRKRTFDLNHLYWMSRHFVWLIPLTNLTIFLVLGVVLSLLGPVLAPPWPLARHSPALRVDLAPAHLGGVAAGSTASPGSSWRWGSRRGWSRCWSGMPRGFRRLVRLSFPVVAGLVPILAASLWGRGPDQGVARGGAAAAAAGFPQRPLDRAGHGGGRPPEPLRLQPSHQPDDR